MQFQKWEGARRVFIAEFNS